MNAGPVRYQAFIGGEFTDAASDAEMRRFLDWKVSQICTLGYDTVKVETLAAEQDTQIVDEELRCKPYWHVSLF